MLHAAVDASTALIKRSLSGAQHLLKAACDAQEQMKLLQVQQPGKFSIFKASGGTIDAFHKGLLHRIGDVPRLGNFAEMFSYVCRIAQP